MRWWPTCRWGDRQRLEILKALYRGARILILDEPTAVLTPQETEQLFGVLALLREQGTTILLITHKLKEVMRLCDFVTVMRGGRVVQDVAIADTSIESLAEAMVGRKVQMGRQGDTDKPPGEVLMQASGIVVRDALQVVRLQDARLRCVPARSWVSPGSPATARANCSRCCPACWRPVPARWRWVARVSAPVPGSIRARPAAGCGPCAGRPPRARNGHEFRGLGVGGARV
jgi:hypothetical protein